MDHQKEFLIHSYLDRELNQEEILEVEELLDRDPEARRVWEELQWLQKNTAKLRGVFVPSAAQRTAHIQKIMNCLGAPSPFARWKFLLKVAAVILICSLLSLSVKTSFFSSTPKSPMLSKPRVHTQGKSPVELAQADPRENILEENNYFDMEEEIQQKISSEELDPDVSRAPSSSTSENSWALDGQGEEEVGEDSFDLDNQITSMLESDN